MHPQQKTFENIATKGEIAHDEHSEQFIFLSQCFQLIKIKKKSFTDIFHIFVLMVGCQLQIFCMWRKTNILTLANLSGQKNHH